MKKMFVLFMAAFLLLTALPAHADIDMNDSCEIEIHAEKVNMAYLTDYTFSTAIDMVEGDGFTVSWDEAAPESIYWEWLSIPDSYTLTLFDGGGQVLLTEQKSNEIRFDCVCPPNEAKCLVLTVSGDCQLTELFTYAVGKSPLKAIVWDDPVDKADIMLIRAHGNDDNWMLGGIVPTYAGERSYKVQIVDLACDTIGRQRKSLPGTHLNGMDNYPVFLGFVGLHTYSYESIRDAWNDDGRDPVELVVDQIRRFRPEVIVTHSIDGDYDGTHKRVAEIVLEAFYAAADPKKYPDSAAGYGAWEAKKLYFHLYTDNPIVLDFDVPLAAFDGKTAFEMAQAGYLCWDPDINSSAIRSIKSREYDMSKYGLAFSSVGADVSCNDLLENIPADCLSDFVPTPSPEPTATPAPMAGSTAIPSAEPTSDTMPEPADSKVEENADEANVTLYLWIGCGLALILVAVGIIFCSKRKRR